VVEALTESVNARFYWGKIKERESKIGIELLTFCQQLKLVTNYGKKYLTDCANVHKGK